MKLNKIYILFSIAFFIFSACSKDETEKALRYNTSSIDPFIMFAGDTLKGGQKVHPDSIKGKISDYFPDSFFEGYTNTTISFINNEIIINSQTSTALPERSIYKFENGSLYIKKDTVWNYIGDGDQSAISIRQHYIGYKLAGDTVFHLLQASPQKDIDSTKVAKMTPFDSISKMNSKEDIYFWCTRTSTFR